MPAPSSKSPARIVGMFDAIAGRYDLLNHLLSAGVDRRWRRLAVRSLSLTGRERVLDVCTGTADLAIAARTASPPAARVIGVDFAGAMLRVGLQASTAAARWPVASFAATPASDPQQLGRRRHGRRNQKCRDPPGCRGIHRVLKAAGWRSEFAIPTTPGVRTAYLCISTSASAICRSSRHNAARLPARLVAPSLLRRIHGGPARRGICMSPHVRSLGIVFLYTAKTRLLDAPCCPTIGAV